MVCEKPLYMVELPAVYTIYGRLRINGSLTRRIRGQAGKRFGKVIATGQQGNTWIALWELLGTPGGLPVWGEER